MKVLKHQHAAILSIRGDDCYRSMICDEDVFPELGRYTWACGTNGYALTKNMYAHQLILKSPPGEGVAIEHINRQLLDNRRANLRWTKADTPQSDLVPDEIKALGIARLPPFVRYESGEGKFSFNDHPFIAKLAKLGVTVSGSGTKAGSNTLAQKLKDCLVKLKDMHTAYYECHPEDSAIVLAREYNELVRFAHEHDHMHFPDGPYAPGPTQDLDAMLAKLITIATPVTGAKERRHTDQLLSPEITIRNIADGRGGAVTTMFDTRHAGALGKVNWDATDLRIHVSPRMLVDFPAVGTTFPGAAKILLPEFVYHILEGHPVLPEHCIVPFDQVKHDVRAANLQQLPGEAKNYKRPTSLVPLPGHDVGMQFLPKGVVMFMDRDKAMFRVASRRINVPEAKDARAVFDSKVLPLLRQADPNFTLVNAKYQALLKAWWPITGSSP